MSEKLEELVSRVAVSDISTAVAFGLQRALERREITAALKDRIILYGGRIDFHVQIAPPTSVLPVQNVQTLVGEG